MSPPPPEPLHHVQTLLGRKYRNPWPSASFPALNELFGGAWLGMPMMELRRAAESGKGVRPVEVVKPDWGKAEVQTLKKEATPFPDSGEDSFVRGTWLGHAGAFVELPVSPSSSPSSFSADPPTLKLLFDPIFSSRAGPGDSFGPKRVHPPPCEVRDLPGVDAVLISHNHYDHLDLGTIKDVMAEWPKARYFVPLGNKPWFLSLGIPAALVFEADWWDEVDLPPAALSPSRSRRKRRKEVAAPAAGSAEQREVIRITCVPAQHTSGRGILDQRSTLCSAIIRNVYSPRTGQQAMDAACDTGYRPFYTSPVICPAFKALGDHYGPFDLSFVPIWRGGTLGFVSAMGLRLRHRNLPCATHGSPGDAVQIHIDVKSRNTVSMHFGTFEGSNLEALEALTDLRAAQNAARVRELDDEKETSRNGRMGRLDIGETYVVRDTLAKHHACQLPSSRFSASPASCPSKRTSETGNAERESHHLEKWEEKLVEKEILECWEYHESW
ncbi:hypothetical protein JCM10213_000190 [Rhodosporidiobolus nylandii]